MTRAERAAALSLLDRPPRVLDGVLRVLDELGPDCSPTEWADRFAIPVTEIRHALAWVDVARHIRERTR
jgi:hypothetical protein